MAKKTLPAATEPKGNILHRRIKIFKAQRIGEQEIDGISIDITDELPELEQGKHECQRHYFNHSLW